MTKDEYDQYFVSQIPLIQDVTKRLISKYKKHYLDSGNIISYTYEYCLKYIDNYENEITCQKYIMKFIKSNLVWERSDLTKAEIIRDSIIENYDINNEDDEMDFDNKVLIEKWYSNKKAILASYRQFETDKVKQIIFDCFFVKGIIVGVELARHLNMNKDAGCRYIREMKADIREFEKNQYNKDKL
jgi:hypothetical protein